MARYVTRIGIGEDKAWFIGSNFDGKIQQHRKVKQVAKTKYSGHF